MALANRKVDYIQQPYIEQVPQQPEFKPNQQPKKKPQQRKKSIFRWSKIEKVSFVAMLSVIALFAILNLNTIKHVQDTSTSIHETNTKLSDIKLENNELSNEVSRLSTPERLMEKAKALGLTSNETNVKVVSGK